MKLKPFAPAPRATSSTATPSTAPSKAASTATAATTSTKPVDRFVGVHVDHQLPASDLAALIAADVATTPQRARGFGVVAGAFADRLPLTVVREALHALIDDTAVAAFVARHPDPGMHIAAHPDLDDAVAAAFAAVPGRRPQALADAVCAVLEQGQTSSGVVDRALVGVAFGSDAVRVFDAAAARARSMAMTTTTLPTAVDLVTALRAPSAQPLRRVLAEAALAADSASSSSVTAAVTRQRLVIDPLVADLLPALRTSVAWRKRDGDAAIADAFSTVLSRFGAAPSLAQFAARYGNDGVDLALALARGGADAAVEFRGLNALVEPARERPAFVDAVRDLATKIGAAPGDITPASTSLARFASAHADDADAIAAMLQLVRVRDTLTLDRATFSFPEDTRGVSKGARFLDDLALALDDKGGGTPATDEAVFRPALIEVLAGLANDAGVVASVDVAARYGAGVAAWFAVVAGGVERGALGEARAEHSLTHVPSGLSEAALTVLGTGLPDVSFAARMQALDVISAKNGGPHALEGFEVVVAQHLFPTTMGLVDALLKNGLDKGKLHLIGKSYSTHERTYAALLGQGIDVDSSSRQDHNLAEDAAVRLAGAARRQLTKIFSGVSDAELADPNARQRFVLFDEGGKLIETLHKEFPRFAKLCIGVEHTDRGMQLLDDREKAGDKILLPVVDMARSAAKKLFESPAIGESVVFHTELELQELGAQPLKKEACIVGYGAVGKATADALRRRGYEVFVHDIDPAALARARADGCEVPAGDEGTRRAAALAHGHLLISCTGRTTLRPDEFASLLPDGAILTNAASGTHELGIHDLGDEQLARRTASESLRKDGIATTTFRDLPIATGPFLAPGKHRHLVFVDGGKEHLVLRGGAVVNMTRGMPPEVVQLTLGLVLTSVLQAAKDGRAGTTKPGRIALSAAEQQVVVDAVTSSLQQRGLPPLSAPDFRTVASWG